MDDILEEDMHHWYTKFMRESPSGLITLFELKTMLEMNGMTEEANSYVDQVFYTFDMDGVKNSSGLPGSRLLLLLILQLILIIKLGSVMISGWFRGTEKNVLAYSDDFKSGYLFLFSQDGYIDFVEYIAAISLLLKGEINQKLKWYFKLFDQDGNGKIDKDELETIFKVLNILYLHILTEFET